MPIPLSARTRPAPISSPSPSSSQPSSPSPRRSTTATPATPSRAIAALQRARYFTAPVPSELGGLGVDSLHDLVVAASRLARGDASLAIGVNMHMAVLGNVVRRWRMAAALGDVRRASAFGETLTEVVHEGAIIATAVSEPGQDLTHPVTTATRTDVGLARRRARRSSARCRRRRPSCSRRSRSSTTTARSATATRASPRPRPAS